MELNDIFALMERFDASGLTSLELELDQAKVRLGKGGTAPAPSAAPDPAEPVQASGKMEGSSFLRAPLVGTFYAAPAPGQPPFVSVGDRVKKGQTVCVLEAMKMMSEIPAPVDCIIEEILVKDGELVGYDAPMFQIREVALC